MSLFLDLVAVAKKGFATGPATGFFSTTEFSHKAGSPSKGFGAVVTSPIHDRMPVILDPDAYNLWLDPSMKDDGAASELLKPFDARLMRCYPVSTRINHVANDDEECSRPVEPVETQNTLF
jgi:hypothetical protein